MDWLTSEHSPAENYFFMTQTILPRPIAWVLTENTEPSSYNLAPFSFFNAVAGQPPLVVFSAGVKRNGEKKDTWANAERTGRFVIHIPHRTQAQAVTDTAQPFDFGVSELPVANQTLVEWPGVPLPRLREARVAFYCTLERIVELPPKPFGLIFGEIQSGFVADELVSATSPRLVIDPKKLDPLSRLGGDGYATLGEVLVHSIKR